MDLTSTPNLRVFAEAAAASISVHDGAAGQRLLNAYDEVIRMARADPGISGWE
jgi:hypothetical protein